MRDLKIFAKTIEQEAIDQIELLLEQPAFKDCKVRIMPDTHAGAGCVIGFTANLGDKVIANVVGVDISCGMLTVDLGKTAIDFQKLDNIIREYIPSGRNVHEGRVTKFDRLQDLKCFRDLKDTKRLVRSVGTLGGGNHFIEIDTDEEHNNYLVIHTGSRNLGKQVADYYQNLAYELMQGKDQLLMEQAKIIEECKSAGRKTEIADKLKTLRKTFNLKDTDVPKALCHLQGEYRDQYLHDMRICQEFSVLNRSWIAKIILDHLHVEAGEEFETIHNYIDLETNIVRKGAINADEGRKLLIPINMRDGCILGVGKGNADWNNSAPHGAGRLMSRRKAKETYTLQEFKNSMEGIFTTSVVSDTIDEAPMVYKNIDEIVECIEPTVKILKIIKPVYNFKASE